LVKVRPLVFNKRFVEADPAAAARLCAPVAIGQPLILRLALKTFFGLSSVAMRRAIS
jgi:hypothetical protein